jgi:hypothetical protein
MRVGRASYDSSDLRRVQYIPDILVQSARKFGVPHGTCDRVPDGSSYASPQSEESDGGSHISMRNGGLNGHLGGHDGTSSSDSHKDLREDEHGVALVSIGDHEL